MEPLHQQCLPYPAYAWVEPQSHGSDRSKHTEQQPGSGLESLEVIGEPGSSAESIPAGTRHPRQLNSAIIISKGDALSRSGIPAC